NSIASKATLVTINEWMAANTRTIHNPVTSQPDDWFELYNGDSNAVDLGGYFLSDVLTNRQKFKIPSGYIVPAHGFGLVWADKQNSYTNGELHVNFKLSKSGSSIGLFAFDTAMVDSVTFGAQVADISEGRYPDGGSDIRQLNPTPGSANALPA